MTSSKNSDDTWNRGDVERADPRRAATDPRAAAQQEKVKEDHDALEESARRVESSISAGAEGSFARESNAGNERHHADPENAAVDPAALQTQNRTKADHDALQESARRVNASVSAEVRDTPVQGTSGATGEKDDASRPQLDEARENADAARESARRVADSTPGNRDQNRR